MLRRKISVTFCFYFFAQLSSVYGAGEKEPLLKSYPEEDNKVKKIFQRASDAVQAGVSNIRNKVSSSGYQPVDARSNFPDTSLFDPVKDNSASIETSHDSSPFAQKVKEQSTKIKERIEQAQRSLSDVFSPQNNNHTYKEKPENNIYQNKRKSTLPLSHMLNVDKNARNKNTNMSQRKPPSSVHGFNEKNIHNTTPDQDQNLHNQEKDINKQHRFPEIVSKIFKNKKTYTIGLPVVGYSTYLWLKFRARKRAQAKNKLYDIQAQVK